MLDHAGIAARLPHAGRMCLLDRMLRWDERSIGCRVVSHRDADNPLRELAGLATLAGIELAAQAAAVHGELLRGEDLSGGRVPRRGVLAALKNVIVARQWLHDIVGDLLVETTLLHSDAAGGIFSFALFDGTECVLSGQFTLMYIDKLLTGSV
jgi:predicted hotdog family 3-hydroxylacyl-ACP dehydratase